MIGAMGGRAPCFQMYGDECATANGTCIRDHTPMSDLADAHVLGLRMLAASAARATIFGHAWAWQHRVSPSP